MLLWLCEQLIGLASALQSIHEADQNKKGEKLFGRHGDLKPENILWFPSDGNDASLGHGTLKIADLGLTRFSHTEEPQSVGDSIPFTAAYRPPELDDVEGHISRSYDIWSLGCVYLEVLIWYLQGKESLDEFRRQRLANDPSLGFTSATFFTIRDETPRSGSVMMVKSAVLEVSLFRTTGLVLSIGSLGVLCECLDASEVLSG